MKNLKTIRLFYSVLATFIFLFTCTVSAHAATYTVSKTADTNDGVCNADCSLREAIGAVNAGAGGDTINIPAGTYTITISGNDDLNALGDFDIRKSVSLVGAGAGATIIDGNGGVIGEKVFEIIGTVTASFSGVTIRNGKWLAGAGGGIVNDGGTLTVVDSTISGNTAGFNGGGIFNNAIATLTVTNSTISGNTAGTDGGGISNIGTLTVNNSTFSGNTANFGGGIFHQAGATIITNSTIASNSANITGGGIYRNFGTVSLSNTIVANQISGANCFGAITSTGHNLESANTCMFAGTGDLTNTDPLLVALANNGGTTQTMALSASSPAIDAGDNTVCNNPPVSGVDQRGVVRPQGAMCDIGAYEYVLASASASIPTLSEWGMILLSGLIGLFGMSGVLRGKHV